SDLQGNVVAGRSMEFGVELKSELAIHQRNENFKTQVFQGKQGLSWQSKYGYVGLTAFVRNIITEGMNEKGLSYGALWFPGAEYSTIDFSNNLKTIPLEILGNWILGNFATVDEVRLALQDIQIWAHEIPGINQVPPLHLAMHDSSGKSLVVEFLEGEMKIYENPLGILTNAPQFTWHLTNLRNYIHLSATNPEPIKIKGTVIGPLGKGSGLLGIPGDWTPPSRFVRIATYSSLVAKVKNPKENANLAFHLLNTVDIPYGAIRSEENDQFTYTQWVTVKDLNNRIFYYRTYEDPRIQLVKFSELEFGEDRQTEYLPLLP
ncbi:MAG: choloylglycine hydrolase family protein, partial [Chlamydiia bacterium]|nr:choloylglycine hydrolase family protein [Chlamydiia bacterium]